MIVAPAKPISLSDKGNMLYINQEAMKLSIPKSTRTSKNKENWGIIQRSEKINKPFVMYNVFAVGTVLYVQGDTTGLLTELPGTDKESGLITYFGSTNAEEECNCPVTWGPAAAGRQAC